MVELDVRLVRSFVAVADERSFTRAAERLHVAQPWISVQIRKLEEQLGFRLFARNRNQGVIVSPEAEAFLPAARDYLAAADRAGALARRIRDNAGATLRLGAPDFSAEMPMRSAIIDGFLGERPDIELEVSNAWTVELLKRLHDGELDIAFTVGPHLDSLSEAMVVARYRLWLLAPTGEFGEGIAPVSLSALAGREIAIFRRNVNPPFHDSIAPVLEAAGVRVSHLSESGMPAIMHNTLRNGVCSIIGDYSANAMLPDGLSVVPLAENALAFNLNLVRRVGDRSPPVAALWTYAMRMVAAS
ncbi:LysR family transcriptional regulator [Sphingomonas sp. 1P06PA]|uniref:LysR family transcriptional regulator n=1 Tax=Sphingomonas sp. 1P06PA TaxID=554121 RepID=UPI0039A41F0F